LANNFSLSAARLFTVIFLGFSTSGFLVAAGAGSLCGPLHAHKFTVTAHGDDVFPEASDLLITFTELADKQNRPHHHCWKLTVRSDEQQCGHLLSAKARGEGKISPALAWQSLPQSCSKITVKITVAVDNLQYRA
jgi:hypothetical protein